MKEICVPGFWDLMNREAKVQKKKAKRVIVVCSKGHKHASQRFTTACEEK